MKKSISRATKNVRIKMHTIMYGFADSGNWGLKAYTPCLLSESILHPDTSEHSPDEQEGEE